VKSRVVSLILLPMLIGLAVVAFLGLTEFGLRQMARIAVPAADGVLAIEEVQGRLFGQWEIKGLRVQTAAADFTFRKVAVQWQPRALLQGKLRIHTLQGEGVAILMKKGPEDPAAVPSATSNLDDREQQLQSTFERLVPGGLVVDTLEVADIVIYDIDNKELQRVEKISLQLTAIQKQITLPRLEMHIPGAVVQVQGKVGLGGQWPLDLTGDLTVEQQEESAAISADFMLNGTMTDQLQAEVDLQTPIKTRINLSGTDLLGDLHWQADAALEQIGLTDVNPDWPELVLASAEITASGTKTTYQGTVEAAGSWRELPQALMQAELAGDLAGLQVSSLVVQLPEGQLTAQGMVGWQDGFNWQAELEGQEINLETYFPDWQGLINTSIASSGKYQGAELSGDMQLLALDGNLFGYPLSGSGAVTVDDDKLQIQELVVRSGESQLSASGTLAATDKDGALDLQVRFDTENLGNLLPAAGGQAHFQGTVRGDRQTPEFSFELEADMISYQDYLLQTLTGSGQGVYSPQGEVFVALAGTGLQIGSSIFSLVSLDLTGTIAQHQLQTKLTGPAGEFDLRVAGGLIEQTWEAEINNLGWRLHPYGDWQLQSPARLLIDEEGIDLASVCLAQDESMICLQGGWQATGEWQLDADINTSAELMYQWELSFLPVEGKLVASVRSAGLGARLTKAEVHLDMPELQVAVLDEEGREKSLRWTDTLFNLEMVDERLVGQARTIFQDGSVANAKVTVEQFGDLSSSWQELPLAGEIVFDVKDLSTLALLSNYTVAPTGALQGEFAIGGVVGNPRLSGELRQIKGNIFIPATGITLEELLLSIKPNQEGQGMHVVLDAVSGPGKLQVKGDINREQEQWQVDAMISGQDFQAVHLPEYEIIIDPDLHFIFRDEIMHLTGQVVVPRAVITIKEFDSALTASRDVIIVDSDDTSEKSRKIDPPLFISVLVEMGQDVRIDSFGLQGRVAGSVMVKDGPGMPLTGKGSLVLHDGIFVLKNRPLAISRGRFFYTDSPLDNPAIDVLAEKKTKKKTVGVIASGTVSDMELKLFSDPPMAESEILTELLSGRSVSGSSSQMGSIMGLVVTDLGFEEGGSFVGDITSRLQDSLGLDEIYVEGGEGLSDMSVMFGKELFEDLYISYGYDPFNATSIFKARYDLWKGYSIETEVGAEKTGADLLWSIEK